MGMKRENFFITDRQGSKLKEIKEKTGVKQAETVRRALDEYFKRHGYDEKTK